MSKHDIAHNIETMLEAVFEGDAACEIENHGTVRAYHSGNGEWYMTVHCPSCKKTTLALTCERYRNTILGLKGTTAVCDECGYEQPVEDAVRSWVRRG